MIMTIGLPQSPVLNSILEVISLPSITAELNESTRELVRECMKLAQKFGIPDSVSAAEKLPVQEEKQPVAEDRRPQDSKCIFLFFLLYLLFYYYYFF